MLVIQRNSACIQLCTWLCLLLCNYSYGKGDESEFISVDAISDNAVKRSVQRAAVWPAQYGSDSAGAELLVDAGAVYGLSVDSEGNAAQCLHAWNSAVYHRLIGGRAVTSICTGGHYDYHAADCFIKQCMDYGNCGADGVLPDVYKRQLGMSQYGAQGMALEKKSYKEILKHYYTGVQIVKE